MHWRALAAAVLATTAATGGAVHAADELAALDTIVVLGTTPLSQDGAALARYPGNAQVFGGDARARTPGLGIDDLLARQAAGVHLAEAAGSPFQADLFYRGYSVSPLLGLPQGLAVYQDGVRVNEIFGDTVNWDLLPAGAIERIELVPGSNPLFGQNALGGALSVRTRTGWDAPGAEAEVFGGAFGRYGTAVSYGAHSQRLAFFGTLETTDEDGWRDFSGSRMRRAFTRGSWRGEDSALDLSVGGADNRVRGNGAAPVELLEDEGREAVFTHPDETRPRLLAVALAGEHRFGPRSQLRASLHFRGNTVSTFNGDGTEYGACTEPGHVDAQGRPFLCEDEDGEEEVVEDLGGEPVVATQDNDSATQNRTRTRMRSAGLAVQWTQRATLLGRPARFDVGASHAQGRSRFASGSELGRLTPDRGTIGSGQHVAESLVRLRADNGNSAAYAAGSLEATPDLSLSAALRYDRTRVRLVDGDPDGDLNGDHRFSRVNPMLGAAWQLAPSLTLFTSVAQSSRAPTPVELTCADPDDPCRLPNGFVSDPPLEQVVTRTYEAGLRGRHAGLRWSAAVFHADSRDDILFITDGRLTTEGYFDNVGKTRRAGLEAGGRWSLGEHLRLSASYTFLVAEFRERFLVNTPNHPLRDADDEDRVDEAARSVAPGDRLPLVPRHLAQAALDWQAARWSAGVELIGRSSAVYRGDEANVDDERLGGFVVANLHGDFRVYESLVLFARVLNVLDREYETFGVYGEADEVLGDDYEDARRFVGPGAPRALLAGVRLAF